MLGVWQIENINYSTNEQIHHWMNEWKNEWEVDAPEKCTILILWHLAFPGTMLGTQTQEEHSLGNSKGTWCSVSFSPPYGERRIFWVTECFPKPTEARLSNCCLLGISHLSRSSDNWGLGSWSLPSETQTSQRTEGTKFQPLQEHSRQSLPP